MSTQPSTPQTISAPRIAPGSRRDVGLLIWLFSVAAGRVGHTTPPNLFMTLGRHRRLFRGWLRFAGRLMPGGRLPRRETELVILRVAHLRQCAYEFDHHVHLGRRAGVTDHDVNRITSDALDEDDGWNRRDTAILNAVDMWHATGDLDDAAWRTLTALLDDREVIELCLLAAHYEMLATAIRTLRIQRDDRR